MLRTNDRLADQLTIRLTDGRAQRMICYDVLDKWCKYVQWCACAVDGNNDMDELFTRMPACRQNCWVQCRTPGQHTADSCSPLWRRPRTHGQTASLYSPLHTHGQRQLHILNELYIVITRWSWGTTYQYTTNRVDRHSLSGSSSSSQHSSSAAWMAWPRLIYPTIFNACQT